MKKFFAIIALILIFNHCSKPVKIEIPDNPIIVVKSYITANDTLRVRVSRSFSSIATDIYLDYQSEYEHGPLDTNKIYLRKAEVKLYKENQFIENLTYTKNGYFIAQHFPKEESEYELKISCEGYESVSAKARIPKAATIENIQLSFVSSQDYSALYKGKLQFHFSEGKNILIFSALDSVTFVEEDNEFQYRYDQLNIGDRLEEGYPTSNNTMDGGFYLEIDSETGQSKSKDFLLMHYKKDNVNVDTIHFIGILKNVTDDYLKLKLSVQKYYDNGGSGFGNPFSSPIQIYSNIEGGLGIFTGISVDTLRLQFIFDNSKEN